MRVGAEAQSAPNVAARDTHFGACVIETGAERCGPHTTGSGRTTKAS